MMVVEFQLISKEKTGRPAVETVFTVLHAGGKFGGGGYKVSGGLHGVGSSVVNALSTQLDVRVHKNGKIHYQEYRRGHVVADLEVIGDTDKTGTIVHFTPDPEIFTETTTFDFDKLNKRIQELAFLNRGLQISITDKREGLEQTKHYHYEVGLRATLSTSTKTRMLSLIHQSTQTVRWMISQLK